jgi:uncharacterized membrane protein YhhN
MPPLSPLPIVAYLASAALAIYGFERRRRWMEVVFKPLTTALLLAVMGPPRSTFGGLMVASVVASVAGDAVLLRPEPAAFLVGLGLFLGAHVTYVVAFATVAAWSGASWAGLAIVAVATPLLLRTLWPGVAGLRAPVVAYAAAVSAMVVAAFSTLGSPLPGAPLAAAGSLLFYASDSSLAINKFVRPIRHAGFFTLGLYWLGQLGIVLTASLLQR